MPLRVSRLQLLDLLALTAWDSRMQHYTYEDWDSPTQTTLLDAGLTYEMGSGVVGLVLGCRPSQWKEGLQRGIQELKRMYTHGLSPEELDYQLGIFDRTYHEAKDPKIGAASSDTIIMSLLDFSRFVCMCAPRHQVAEH